MTTRVAAHCWKPRGGRHARLRVGGGAVAGVVGAWVMIVLLRPASLVPQETFAPAASSPAVAFVPALPPDALARTMELAELRRLHASLTPGASPEEKTAVVNALLTRWLAADPIGAAFFAARCTGESFDDEIARRVVNLLTDRSRARAADFVLGLPAGALQTELLAEVVPAWAASDWPAAESWARALPDDQRGKQAALIHLLHAWEQNDPDELLMFAARLPPGFQQFQALVASHVAAEDPQLALEWASLIASPGARGQALTSAAVAWATTQPREAADYASRLPSDERAPALLAIMSMWGARDCPAAVAWVAAFPNSTLRTRVVALMTTTALSQAR